MLIEYTGRNTGNPLTTPASYHIEKDRIHAFSAATSGWWKNLAALPKVHLTVRGARAPSSATVISGADSALEDAFARFLQAVPRDARHAGVRLDANGDPNRDDVRRVVPRMVHVHFPIALVSP